MQRSLASSQNTFFLLPLGVRYTAVNRANGGALRLFVEAYTFGTLIRHDVVELITDGLLLGVGLDDRAGFNLVGLGDGSALGHFPFYAAFVDGGVGAFGFAGSAVDTVVGNENCHLFSLLGAGLLVQTSVFSVVGEG